MKKLLKVILGLGIILAGIGLSTLLWITRPEAVKDERVEKLTTVEVMPVELRAAVFQIPSQGIVEADRRVRMAAEVAGKVVDVADEFEVGTRVSEGTTLLTIDRTDYEAALAQAHASLAEAQAALASETARAVQAQRDVSRLGSSIVSELALRKPQLKSAQGRVDSAQAAVTKAEGDLRRTVLKAPFDAIISSKATEIGSYLAPGMEVAEVFGTSPYEVRLPLSVDEVAFLNTDEEGNPIGSIEVLTSAAGESSSWTANIIRTEGEIDRTTRSIHVIAEIGADESGKGMAPRPGMFVQASIPSREIRDLAKIPFSAFLDLESVAVVDPDDRIRFRKVDVVHRDGDDVFVSSGLENGDRVCITELPDLVEGTHVSAVLMKVDNSSDETASAPKP